MRANQVRILNAYYLAILLVGFGCAKPPEKIKPVFNSAPFGVSSEISLPLTLDSFRNRIYAPILSDYCLSCHEKSFANQDIESAYKAFLTRIDFDKFNTVEQIPIVNKMRENHNCWEAETNLCVSRLSEAISLWLKDIELLGYKPKSFVYPNLTMDRALEKAVPSRLPIDKNEDVGADIQTASLSGNFVKMNGNSDGLIQDYAKPAVDDPGLINLQGLSASNTVPANHIAFNFNVQSAGTYYLYARIKSDSAENKFFYTTINGAAGFFEAAQAGSSNWEWASLRDPSSKDLGQLAITIDSPGTFVIPTWFFSSSQKIDFLALTKKADGFDGDIHIKPFLDISIDLPLAGSRIIATVWELTKEDGKRSLGVRGLRIESARKIRVKSIYPLINGHFSLFHNSYTRVDTVVGGMGDRSAQSIGTGGSRSSTWIADITKDRLSFSFEQLEFAD